MINFVQPKSLFIRFIHMALTSNHQKWSEIPTMQALIFIFAIFSILKVGSVSLGNVVNVKPNLRNVLNNEEPIDKALYSRQLFVYGESAQLSLQRSTILLIGSGSLNNEIVKNVALSGIGKIIFANPVTNDVHWDVNTLLGTKQSLTQYATGLNRNVMVRTLSLTISCIHPFDLFYLLFLMTTRSKKSLLTCRQTSWLHCSRRTI